MNKERIMRRNRKVMGDDHDDDDEVEGEHEDKNRRGGKDGEGGVG